MSGLIFSYIFILETRDFLFSTLVLFLTSPITWALAAKEFHHSSKTDKNVHNKLYLWPRANQKVYDIQILSNKSTNTNKSPVEGTNGDKEARNVTRPALCTVHKKVGKEIHQLHIAIVDKKNIQSCTIRCHCTVLKI